MTIALSMHVFSHIPVVTIGFRPTSYNVIESSGSVEVCISLLSGTFDDFINLTVMAHAEDFNATGLLILQ